MARSGDRWSAADWCRLVVVLIMGGAGGHFGADLLGRNGTVAREAMAAEVERSCLYRDDRSAVRADLRRCEEAIKELTDRVTDLTRSWDATRGRLELMMSGYGKSQGVEP